MKKLKNQKGETLVETLVSLLIIVLVFVFLTGSAVAAAKINAKIRDTDVSFRYSDAQSEGNAQLRLSGRSARPAAPRWRSIRRTTTATMCRRIRHEKTP